MKVVNSELYLKRIGHLIGMLENKIKNIKNIFYEIEKIIEKLIVSVKYTKHKHKKFLHPTKMKLLDELEKALKEFRSKAKKTDYGYITRNYQQIISLFYKTFDEGDIYLLRHPEKTSKEGRNLSVYGVKQAINFAEFLCEEILLCPKETYIFVFASSKRRTQLFGEFIIRKLLQLVNFYDKKIKVIEFKEDSRLSFINWTNEGLDATDVCMEKYSSFYCFKGWFEGKINFVGTSNPRFVVRGFKEFVDESKKRIIEYSKEKFVIVIGISHQWLIDSYIYKISNKNVNDTIHPAEFAKIDYNELLYRGKWYKI